MQAREGLHSNTDCLCTALMPSFSLMGIFPKPDHQRSQPCHNISLHTQCCRGFPHSVLMTLRLMHSPIWIRILVRMPIDILDTPLRPGKMLLKYWSLFPSPWQGPRVCLRSVSTSGTTPKCSCSTSFFFLLFLLFVVWTSSCLNLLHFNSFLSCGEHCC